MQYLSFIPAELNEIFGQNGLSWPKHLPMAASGGTYRSLQAICDWHEVDSSKIPLPLILEVLVQGSWLLTVERMARRKTHDRWQIYSLKKTNWIAAFSTSGAMIDLTWFEDGDAFLQWLSEDYQNFSLPEIPTMETGTMSLVEWGLQCGLCDQFLRIYPHPNIDWTPDQLLVFTIDSLRLDMKQKGGWTDAWAWMLPLPSFSDADLEEVILMWCNESRLGELDMPDNSSVYTIGNSWLWLTRAMAWWDKGFMLTLPKQKEKLYIVQATALWAIGNDGRYVEATALAGSELQRLLTGFLGKHLGLNSKQPTKAAVSNAFCPSCGKAVGAEDKFCRSCGAKL